jgi:hypothetical protein
LIHVEPQPLEDIPEELQRIIRKALRKNAAERYQALRTFALDLKDLRVRWNAIRRKFTSAARQRRQRQTSSTSENANLDSPDKFAANATGGRDADWTKTASSFGCDEKNFEPYLQLGLLAAFVVLVFGAVYFLSNLLIGSAPKFDAIQVSRLTETGNAHQAAISPGRKAGFVCQYSKRASKSRRSPSCDRQLGRSCSGERRRLMQPSFSPDGDYIFYVSASKGIGTLYQISALGGERKKLVQDIDSSVTFSP